ncbi:adenosylcobinamide-phosphate synthase CbiB [Sphingomonas sp. GM_Shp_2]|uniref:adenosylcobinamide-phosphate synthase CbiB n=1 Tax=Sphingomonas sp. GM_Shp_2 TaxID=2937380 RepID=UPI00226A28CE|nr:adenosylcobinamide-phosphate synthase CbiB [Sphingomonas sp. GM_Shp_2]
MNQAAALLAILMLEAVLGYPWRWRHPVEAVGALIAAFERRWRRHRRIGGVVLLAVLIGLAVAAGLAIGMLGWVAVVLVGTTGLAQRSLHDHVSAVATPLAAGDLVAARGAVAMIVGRDTDTLDEGGVATAAIESLAESFCDGVVAPAFWFLIGGLPGLFVAKAINTADSMVGHRTERLAAFGWASAKADDVINWLPAQIAGLLICLVGRGGWRVMLRDAGKHASPNGGWPESAMAGVLGRRLGGPVCYDGEPAIRAVLGDGAVPGVGDLRRALRVYRGACLMMWMLVGVIAWAR